MLTDYRAVFLDEVTLSTKFTQLNPKLSGSDDLLVAKITELLKSSSSKHDVRKNLSEGKLVIDVEDKIGTLMVKWHFDGKELNDGGNTVCPLFILLFDDFQTYDTAV